MPANVFNGRCRNSVPSWMFVTNHFRRNRHAKQSLDRFLRRDNNCGDDRLDTDVRRFHSLDWFLILVFRMVIVTLTGWV
jgi:hypothetical protein